MLLWIVDKDEEVHFLHTMDGQCQINLSLNPQDKAWIFQVKDLGSFAKAMGLGMRWNRLCPNCASRFFEALDCRRIEAPPPEKK